MKKLKSVCLISDDVLELRDFYASLLGLTPEGDESFVTFSAPDMNLSISSTQLLVEMVPGFMNELQPGNFFLEFEVEDVDREYERLKALKIKVIKPPTTQPWGLRSVWFYDIQGNKINFYAPVARR